MKNLVKAAALAAAVLATSVPDIAFAKASLLGVSSGSYVEVATRRGTVFARGCLRERSGQWTIGGKALRVSGRSAVLKVVRGDNGRQANATLRAGGRVGGDFRGGKWRSTRSC